MRFYKISEDLIKGLLVYLMKKPFHEVEEGVNSLRNLEEIEEKKEDKKDDNN